ncbi:MAG: UDP-N-acetylglucosamine--N-acetylmuramyl-(pentapeptide) pyrophosphoryl-undecaprenol N-acetylglucosamine transferase [Actinobacteria bacterium]|nr:UDP-N-acetylglucosamine--N-acetylmuramyl-(pentapeptide) pyrophosphoryl-undecaprenol N-acetylglucosamine transferase [Actinomycetota bacterium]
MNAKDSGAHPKRIVFAGGGSAGHVEPALAVARAWKQKYPEDSLLFLGTPSGLENSLVPSAGFELHIIPKVVMPRTLRIDLVTVPVLLWRAVREAKVAMRGTDLLIGFGGYLSAPAYIAARFTHIPIVIHEANAKVGWANRLGAFFTNCLAIAHPIRTGTFSRATVTGIPLREDVKSAVRHSSSDWKGSRDRAKSQLGWDLNRPLILILGGSQGSAFINSQIAAALPHLIGKGIQVFHSIGAKNELPQHSANYKPVAYIDDMALAYLASDLIIARSGAVTCAEVGALGKGALFVPLPIGNGEQARNADYLVEAKRARVIDQKDFSADWLVEHVDELLSRSADSTVAGLTEDLDAERKIIALMERAIDGKCG